MPRRYGNVLDRIGRTPLVPIRRLKTNPRVQIVAKVESVNPGGSIKDRIALSMIEAAERTGDLTREKTIIEASSGNTGIGLALVSAVKGYRCLIAMSEGASVERRRIMRAFGAEILLTPAEKGTDGAIEAVYELARQEPDRYYLTDQFNNPANWQAHYRGTAPEIWEDTGGRVTHVVAGMGTTGTLMGLARYFRDRGLPVRVVGVEPYPGHRLQGLKNMKESYPPGIFERRLLDRVLHVHDEEAFALTRRLAREEGLFVGMSSGAALAAALELAKELEEGLVVVIFPDGGERYLSTNLWSFEDLPERQLRFTNTLSRRKEPFVPRGDRVGIYTCGPTVHRRPHLGLYRRMVTADLLRRFLEHRGYEVVHVVNITDYDDRTIAAAREEGRTLAELTAHYTRLFFEDLDTLRVRRATHYPRASEHLEDMVSVTRRLLEEGWAYVRHGSVYFDVSKLEDYGVLSGTDPAKLKTGLTVDFEEYDKDDPLDFTLFKRATLYELREGIYLETEWGKVRPGWHVQCAAMALRFLGEEFDIHTSGTDLIFPHHEDEMAIARALTGRPLARYWIHSALVFHEERKMSFSAGNAVTVPEVLARGYTGRELRYFLLRTHYRKPLRFSWEALDAARKSLRNLDLFMLLLGREPGGRTEYPVRREVDDLRDHFEAALEDDLNISAALAALFDFANRLYPVLARDGLTEEEAQLVREAMRQVDKVLAILSWPTPTEDPEALTLLRAREEARREGRYQEADRLRDLLREKGFVVIDTPRGPVAGRLDGEH